MLTNISGKSGSKASNFPDGDDKPKLPGGEKMKLILELSQQVTEQQDKIVALQKQVEDKDKIVKELRAKMKNNADYLKAINQKGESGDSRNNSNSNIHGDRNDNNNSNIRRTQSYSSTSMIKSQPVKKMVSPEVCELAENGEDSMSKLTSLLQSVKPKKTKHPMSDDIDELLEEADRRSQVLLDGNDVTEPDGRTGRDSGLGSAGKREEEEQRQSNDRKKVLLDWQDSGSGLSDSDLEPSNYSSKVSSAPPTLRSGTRQKKKSHVLRKRVPSHDRPPRPGMAFMNSVVEETAFPDHMDKSHRHISPVEVS